MVVVTYFLPLKVNVVNILKCTYILTYFEQIFGIFLIKNGGNFYDKSDWKFALFISTKYRAHHLSHKLFSHTKKAPRK